MQQQGVQMTVLPHHPTSQGCVQLHQRVCLYLLAFRVDLVAFVPDQVLTPSHHPPCPRSIMTCERRTVPGHYRGTDTPCSSLIAQA